MRATLLIAASWLSLPALASPFTLLDDDVVPTGGAGWSTTGVAEPTVVGAVDDGAAVDAMVFVGSMTPELQGELGLDGAACGEAPTALGFAVARDGLYFEPVGRPVILPGDEYPCGVADPVLAFDGTLYHLWFVGRGVDGSTGGLRYARSVDGVAWDVSPTAALAGDVREPSIVRMKAGQASMWRLLVSAPDGTIQAAGSFNPEGPFAYVDGDTLPGPDPVLRAGFPEWTGQAIVDTTGWCNDAGTRMGVLFVGEQEEGWVLGAAESLDGARFTLRPQPLGAIDEWLSYDANRAGDALRVYVEREREDGRSAVALLVSAEDWRAEPLSGRVCPAAATSPAEEDPSGPAEPPHRDKSPVGGDGGSVLDRLDYATPDDEDEPDLGEIEVDAGGCSTAAVAPMGLPAVLAGLALVGARRRRRRAITSPRR